MTSTTNNTALIARYASIFPAGNDWSVTELTDAAGDTWLLVDDTATRYFVEASDIDEAALDQFDADRAALADIDDDADDDIRDNAETRSGNAYSILCQSITGAGDDDVPAEVLAAAREELGLGDDEAVCFGW